MKYVNLAKQGWTRFALNSMGWWLNWVCGFAAGGCRKLSSDEREFIRSFSFLYPEVLQACSILVTDGTEKVLAQRYMMHVLDHQNPQWWSEYGEYAQQPWFVWQYACEHGLATPPARTDVSLRVMPIMPEGDEPATILLLQIERNTMQPDQGLIHLQGAQDALTEEQAKQLRCKYIPGGYVRKVDECSAPILDRAVEMGLALLKQGIGICVQEKVLYERILREEYQPAHYHWIRETESPDWLRVIYPYDPVLHNYLIQMGGRWTGKQMFFPVTLSERLKDIISLYDFRLTVETGRRLELWAKARENATIYCPRRARNEPPKPEVKDRFHQLLLKGVEVPADLIDPTDG